LRRLVARAAIDHAMTVACAFAIREGDESGLSRWSGKPIIVPYRLVVERGRIRSNSVLYDDRGALPAQSRSAAIMFVFSMAYRCQKYRSYDEQSP
jgi:hypothetical protein